MKMTILVGIQGDGCTFRLEPYSRQLLDATRADETLPPTSLFLGYDTQQDFVHMLGQDGLRWTVAEVLTGLRRDEIAQIAQLEFVDPSRNFARIDPAA